MRKIAMSIRKYVCICMLLISISLASSLWSHEVKLQELKSLFQAVKQGKARQVNKLISQNPDLEDFIYLLGIYDRDFTSLSQSPIFLAANRMHQAELDKVLRDIIGLRPTTQQFLVYTAAKAGKLDVVKLLLREHQNMNVISLPDSSGKTLLQYALESKNVPLINFLFQFFHTGTHPKSKEVLVDQKQLSLLLQAIRQGDKNKVIKLIKDSPNLIDGQTKTVPLIAALSAGKLGIAQVLIEHGADVNKLDAEAQTPIYIAVIKNYPTIVKLLLDYGADPLLAPGGISLLHEAAQTGKNAIVQLLASRRSSDLNNKDKFGKTPLMYAIKRNNLPLVRLLLLDTNVLKDWSNYQKLLGELDKSNPTSQKIINLLTEKHKTDWHAAISMIRRL